MRGAVADERDKRSAASDSLNAIASPAAREAGSSAPGAGVEWNTLGAPAAVKRVSVHQSIAIRTDIRTPAGATSRSS